MLTLYYCPGSSSMAPHMALNEIGAPFEARLISLKLKQNRAPDYLAINPEGKVPTLVIDGRPLTEVAAILFYLAKRFPEAKLLPANDPETEARAVSWMSFTAATLHPARSKGVEIASAAFAIAEKKLGANDWALGAFSIADIHLFRLYWRFRGSYEIDVGRFPRLEAHYARMMARPAVKKTCEIEAAAGLDLPK